LRIVPSTRDAANAFVRLHHRHAGVVQGYRFAIAAERGGQIVGVAIVGRPVSRTFDDGRTAEITRLCTDGTKNACSFLYSAARRAARALGYERVITYTLATESGASLRAAGFVREAEVRAESWDRPGRARSDKHNIEPRVRWGIAA
jgi:hypothetical protein